LLFLIKVILLLHNFLLTKSKLNFLICGFDWWNCSSWFRMLIWFINKLVLYFIVFLFFILIFSLIVNIGLIYCICWNSSTHYSLHIQLYFIISACTLWSLLLLNCFQLVYPILNYWIFLNEFINLLSLNLKLIFIFL
jgi:hypothetical protein